jgi:hypothetical protein
LAPRLIAAGGRRLADALDEQTLAHAVDDVESLVRKPQATSSTAEMTPPQAMQRSRNRAKGDPTRNAKDIPTRTHDRPA